MRAGSAGVGTVPASADVLGATVAATVGSTVAAGASEATGPVEVTTEVSGAEPTAFDGSSENRARTPETSAIINATNTARTMARRIMNVRRLGRGRRGGC